MKPITTCLMLAAIPATLTAAMSFATARTTAVRQPAPFRIERVALPGAGRGDYITVDRDTRRLFVTHTTAIHILDLDTLRPIATVTGLANAHGVVVDPASGQAFVSDGGRDTVVMFDPATGAMLKSIPVGKKPDAMLRDPASGMLFAFDGDQNAVSVVDPAKQAVIATIALPGGPEFAQADGKGKVWVNLSDTGAIAEIDTQAMRLVRTIPLPGCDDVTPLALDAARRVLFAGCGNRVMKAVDADSGAVLATVPIGGDPDGIVYDAGRQRIVVANRDGGWTIVSQRDRSHYAVAETLPIDRYAKTVAVDLTTHRVFSSTADFTWPKPVAGVRASPSPIAGTFRLLAVSER